MAAAGIVSCLMLFTHVLAGLRISNAPSSVYRSLRSAPEAVVWKLLLLARIVRRPSAVAWTQTTHNEEESSL